jgi:phosphoglycolate phosphatase
MGFHLNIPGSTEFKAVIFDLDGTLLNTLEDISDSMNIALKSMGMPTHHCESYKLITGDGIQTFVWRSLPENRRDEATIRECITRMRAEYAQRYANKTRPYDGIPILLDTMVRRNVNLNILSNKLDEFAKLVVQRFLPNWKFSFILGVSPNCPKKPDPDGALHIARGLGLSPAEFLYIGDTSTDMETAVRSGMYPVGALWGFRTKEELEKSGARLILTKPEDLLKLMS